MSVGTTDFRCRFWNKALVKFEHCKLRRVENLVTELAVSLHAEDLEVDITT